MIKLWGMNKDTVSSLILNTESNYCMMHAYIHTLISIKLVTRKSFEGETKKDHGYIHFNQPRILIGLTFEALRLTNFIEMSVYVTYAVII